MLNKSITLYVPTTMDVNVIYDTTAILEMAIAELASIAGGATVNESKGYWVDENGQLVGEKIYQIEVFYTDDIEDKLLGKAYQLAEQIKRELKQEAVSVKRSTASTLQFI